MLSSDSCKIANKYISKDHKNCIHGYVRNIEKLGLYSTIPYAIINRIIVNTYYFELFPNMIKLTMKPSQNESQQIVILQHMMNLLNQQQAWDQYIINHFDETEVMSYYLNKLKNSKCQKFINTTWSLLATIELNNTKSSSILIKYNSHQIIFSTLHKFRSFETISVCFHALAQMSNFDAYGQNILINDNILEVLSVQVDRLFFQCNYSYKILEIWYNVSSLQRNLSRNNPMPETESKFAAILLLSLCKMIKFKHFVIQKKKECCLLNKCNQNITKVCQYKPMEILCDDVLFNLVLTLYRLTNTISMLHLIISRMIKPQISLNLLKECINLLDNDRESIRLQVIKFFNNIFFDSSIQNINMCLQYGLIDKYILLLTQKKHTGSTDEQSNIIVSLSNLLCSTEDHQLLILSNNKLFQIILDALFSPELGVIKSALYFVNNMFEINDQNISLKFLKAQDAQLIKAICYIIENVCIINDAAKPLILDEWITYIVMECLSYTVDLMKFKDTENHWIVSKLKSYNLIQILKKLNILKEIENKICVQREFLTENGLNIFITDLEYLSQTVIN